MEDRKGLEADKKSIDYRKIASGFLLVIGVSLLALSYIQTHPDVTYRAYILQNQYIGDIQDNERIYNDVLIMDVIPLETQYDGKSGHRDLMYDTKYGFHLYNLDDPMSNFRACKDPHKLYFANENITKPELQDDDIIVVRWVNPFFGNNHIEGVQKIEDW